jgi:hypothetical protein
LESKLIGDLNTEAELLDRGCEDKQDFSEFICRELVDQMKNRKMDDDKNVLECLINEVKWPESKESFPSYKNFFIGVVTDMENYLNTQRQLKAVEREFLAALFHIIPFELAAYFLNGLVEVHNQRIKRTSLVNTPLHQLKLNEKEFNKLVSSKKELTRLMIQELMALEGHSLDSAMLIPKDPHIPSVNMYPAIAHLIPRKIELPKSKAKVNRVVGKTTGGKSPPKETKGKADRKGANHCFHCGEKDSKHFGRECKSACQYCKKNHPGSKCAERPPPPAKKSSAATKDQEGK